MGNIRRQTLFTSVFIYMGLVLGYINVTILYPVVLGPEKFGYTRWLLSVSAIFAFFGQLGVSNLTTRFFPYFKDKDQQHNGFLGFISFAPFFSTMAICLLVILLKDVVIMYFCKEEDVAIVQQYYFLLPPAIIITVYTSIFSSYGMALLKTAVPSFLKEVFSRFYSLFILLLLFVGWVDFTAFLWLLIAGMGLKVLGLVAYFKWLGQLFLRFDWGIFKRPIFKEMKNYGLYAIFARGSGIIIHNIDIIMISSFLGMGGAGVYAVFLYVSRAITVPANSLTPITATLVSDAWKRNDLSLIYTLYKKTSINQLAIGALLLIGVWSNIDNLLVLLGDDYAAGKYVVLIIGLAQLFNMGTGNNGIIILQSKYYRVDLIFVAILLILTVATNYLLIPVYGITGAAMATALTIFINNVLTLFFVWWKMDMQPFDKQSVKVLVISAVALGVNYLIPVMPHFILDILVRSALITLVYGGLTLYWNISEDIDRLVSNVVQKAKQILSRFR